VIFCIDNARVNERIIYKKITATSQARFRNNFCVLGQ
jgi:hypothetical protein